MKLSRDKNKEDRWIASPSNRRETESPSVFVYTGDLPRVRNCLHQQTPIERSKRRDCSLRQQKSKNKNHTRAHTEDHFFIIETKITKEIRNPRIFLYFGLFKSTNNTYYKKRERIKKLPKKIEPQNISVFWFL